MPNPTNDPISEILYPIYNYGWPGTGMPNTQRQMTYKEAHQAISKILIEKEAEELEMAADFAEDVLNQFGYNGKSGGLSTLEWAEGIIKRHHKLQQQLTTNKSKEK